MGRFNVNYMRDLSKEDLRALAAIEVGMKNHEIVPGPLAAQLANSTRGGVCKRLRNLSDFRLCSYERGKNYDGYRLTNLGYDYLALSALLAKNVISAVGSKFGCGKESDIYLVQDEEENCRCMKIHRLGRTSFKKLKEKRDYHKERSISSWLYLSRISAKKEFEFLNILFEHKFPVPQPYGHNRHIVIMEEILGDPLCHFKELEHPEQLFSDLMDLILKLANHGLIHCDFNEFNIMITNDGKPVLIDFPQMVSIDHKDAEEYFDRDVNCLATFFKRRFNYECDGLPTFKDDVERTHYLDKLVKASGAINKESESSSDEDDAAYEEDYDSKIKESGSNNKESQSTSDEENNVTNETYEEEDNSKICPVSEKNILSKKQQKALASKEIYNMKMAKLKEERRLAKERLENMSEDFDDVASCASGITAMSSISGISHISAKDLKHASQRINTESKIKIKKQIPKKNIRVKGEANAFRRKKLENLRVIKEYDSFFD